MSVALLEDPQKCSVLQDDLESFFYVLLYIVLRYLKHNFLPGTVGDFMDDFFDSSYAHHDGTASAGGDRKRSIIELGRIAYGDCIFELHTGFKHPLKVVTAALFSWFRAYHAVYVPRQTSVQPPRELREEETMAPPDVGNRKFGRKARKDLASGLAAEPDKGPASGTNIDTSLSNKLDSHDDFLDLLGRTVDPEVDMKWPNVDKVLDQLPPDYQPHRRRRHIDKVSSLKRGHEGEEAGEHGPLKKSNVTIPSLNFSQRRTSSRVAGRSQR